MRKVNPPGIRKPGLIMEEERSERYDAILNWDEIQKNHEEFPEYWACIKCQVQVHTTFCDFVAKRDGTKITLIYVHCGRCHRSIMPSFLKGKIVIDMREIINESYAGL